MSGVPGNPDRPQKSSPGLEESAQVAKRTAADAEAALRQFEVDQSRKDALETPDAIGEKPLPSQMPDVNKPVFRHQWFGLRQPTSLLQSIIFGAAMILLVFAIWWSLTTGEIAEDRIVSPAVLPSPAETIGSVRELYDLQEGEPGPLDHTWATIRRVALGFALATLVGVPLGVLAGCFMPVRTFLAPLVIFGRNIPIAALIPITMLLFLGLDEKGEVQKIMFIFIACVAFIIADTTTAIMDVSQKYVDTAFTLGATRWQTIIKVLVPLCLPSVFNSLRVLFGLAFGYIMLAELINDPDATGGLGFLINTSQRRGKNAQIYLIIIVIPIIALAIDRLLFWVQKQLFPYRYKSSGILNLVVRGFFAVWDDLKTKLLGTKSPFDELVVMSTKATDSSRGSTSHPAVDAESGQR